MSPELKQFYRDIQKWIDDGCIANRSFLAKVGLCQNLNDWCYVNTLNHKYHILAGELEEQFAKAELDESFPFNEGSPFQYNSEYNHFTNPQRLAWIKEHSQ